MIFKIHYGLWYGALVGIIPFMFNYAAEYSGATGTQHGILYTILPFVALLAKPLICSLADKYAAHHHCLLFFIFTTILGYGSLAIYPFIPSLKEHKQLIWILYCLAALVGNTSMCIVNSIGDSLAINSCQKKDISYGDYRLWGPVGFGIFGAIWGIANEIPSMPKYTPGIFTMVLLLIINSLFIAFWYDREEFKVIKRVLSTHPTESAGALSNYGSTELGYRIEAGDDNDNNVTTIQPNQNPKVSRWRLLWKLAKQESSIFGYLFLFTFCGVMTAVHWQFFFKFLEKTAGTSFSTVATLALPVQALGGELVFFMLADTIVKKLGASLSLVISLFSFACRYLLYAYVIPSVSIYWILLVELFQGPAFGLMYCVLTHQANYYSEKIDQIATDNSLPGDVKFKNSLHATLQGFLGASFEGLGLGLGAIIGGFAYDVEPMLMWQIAGFSALAVSILCLLITIMSFLMRSSKGGNRGDLRTSATNGDESGTEESQIIEELRRIARNCQELPAPNISDIRAQLERLANKARTTTTTSESSH